MKKKINTQLIGIAILAILATAIGLTLVYFNLLDRQIKVDLKINADILRDVHYFETDAPLDTIHLSDELDPLTTVLRYWLQPLLFTSSCIIDLSPCLVDKLLERGK